MQDEIFNLLVQQDEITWQTIIYELIKSEKMNPWDIDISILTKRYIDTIKKLKEANFMVSGKVLLASAILLRIKSNKLVEEDISMLDAMFAPPEEYDEIPFDDIELQNLKDNKVTIIPKTPQPRRRKVNVNDLVAALEKALDVNQRRYLRRIDDLDFPEVKIPERKVDLTKIMRDVYNKIMSFFSDGGKKLVFTDLVKSDRKEDKIATFIPLLHLSNDRKINLEQVEHFGEIEIRVN